MTGPYWCRDSAAHEAHEIEDVGPCPGIPSPDAPAAERLIRWDESDALMLALFGFATVRDAVEAIQQEARAAVLADARPDAALREWVGLHAVYADKMPWGTTVVDAEELDAFLAAASPDSAPAGLDAAWQNAEAALPEGWLITSLTGGRSGGWMASAEPTPAYQPIPARFGTRGGTTWLGRAARGETPAAALLALAARLRATPASTTGPGAEG